MKVLGLTLALLVLLGLRLDLHHGLGPRGTDGQYYYAQARSLVVDGDLDLRRELGELTPRPENVNTSTDRPWDEPTATGRVPCKYPVGAPLLQVPFLAVGQLLALGLDAAGVEVRTDGYSAPCYLAWRVGVWAFATLLLWAAAGFARRVTGLGPEAGMACAAAAVLCGPLLYFCTGDPYSAHVHSAALVAAALLLAVDPAALPRRLRGTAPLWIGLCCGLAVCTRATNGLWLGAAGLLLLLGGAPD
ncbi:MAG: hypothetical protein R3F30_16310, partial [Planctomycetota bacterium]